MLRIQPDWSECVLAFPDLMNNAGRIRWITGNLYVHAYSWRLRLSMFCARLEPLPFEPATFDLVRATGIGLGVPEDEVEHLFCVSF